MSELALELIAKAKAEKWTTLDLRNCKIAVLPKELFKLTRLKELILSEEFWDDAMQLHLEYIPSESMNSLDSLDGDWGKLANLNKLVMGRQIKITDLSPLIDLSSLKSLYISNSTISNLSPLAHLKSLEKLRCTSSNIENISPLANIQSIKALYLSNTKIENLDPLSNLNSLNVLDCSSTYITDLSPLTELQSLNTLYCSRTRITHLEPLANLQYLKKLNCSNTEISDLNPLANLQYLEELNCSSTEISDLNPLVNLHYLTEFNCGGTRIGDLNPLANLKYLKKLNCACTQIKNLNPLVKANSLEFLNCDFTKIKNLVPLANIESLRSLSISHSKVRDISPLGNKKKLDSLDCSYSLISDVSPLANSKLLNILLFNSTYVKDISSLGALQSLKVLGCSTIYVTTIPKCVIDLPKLEDIEFSEDVKNIPPGLSEIKDIKAYFQQIEADLHTQPDLLFKVVLLGNGCVGKTSLLNRLEKGEEARLPTIEERTHAIQMKQWPVPTSELIANIWDFGGQEIYHATHRLFLASRALYLVLWSNKEELEKGEERYGLQYWLDLILAEGQHNRVILIQNRFTGEALAKPTNWYQLIEHYEERGLLLERPISIDCKNNKQIEEVIMQTRISLEYMQKQRDYILPQAWGNIRKLLLHKREQGVHTLPYAAFKKIYQAEGMEAPAAKALLQFLHHNGIIYYHYQKLNDDIILNQQWAITALYAFLDRQGGPHYQKIKDLGGVLPASYLSILWPAPDYDEDSREILLNFITSNEIGFKIENDKKEDEYLIPQLLPSNPKNMAFRKGRLVTSFWLKIEFPFLHKGVVNRMLFRLRKLNYEDSTSTAVIIEDKDNNQSAYIGYQKEEGSTRAILLEAENKTFGVQLLNEIGKIISLESTTILASMDGENYLGVTQIREAWQNGEQLVRYQGKDYPTQAFQQYLTFDKEEQLFEGDVAPKLLEKYPDLRYTTEREKVKSLAKMGDLDEAIAAIPAALSDNDLATAISNYRAVRKDHLLNKTTQERFEIARTKFVDYILEFWG